MQRLTGGRVILREFRQEDISGIRSWVTDYGTTRFLSSIFLKPHTWEQTETYLNSLLSGDAGGVNLVIAEKESRRYLGQCNLMKIDNVARTAELALVMAPDSVGHGYATEALRLLLDFAFEQMNLNRVWLEVFADNAAAIRVYEKCGFKHEGTLRSHFYRDGQYQDVLVMGILRGEFQP